MAERWYKKGRALQDEIRGAAAEAPRALLWFLGQMGFVVKINGVIIYFDPFLNDFTDENGAGRSYEAPFLPGPSLEADYFVCSHNHADHLNLQTLLPQARTNPKTRFIVPRPFTGLLTDAGIDRVRVVGAQAGLALELDGALTLSPVAAAHTAYETDKNGDDLYLGYVLDGKGCRIYHAGDTVVTPRLVQTLKGFKPLNIAILPVNGGDWERASKGIAANMTVEDAVKLLRVIDADLSVPAHYDLFSGNAVNPSTFAEAMYRLCPSKKYHIFAPGECFRYHV
ncbi:MAG: MBL fold metallo-hydrolase [Spirochaetaceae bacterium]|jgi:L-ascorbate metabolism protein UlaG (beta-lactamase superfamily)|nr:MBL fold metallo-hydrolase [Spirochaetaceae bacterium]